MITVIRTKAATNRLHLGAFICASFALHSLLLIGGLHDDVTPGAPLALAVTLLAPDQAEQQAYEANKQSISEQHTGPKRPNVSSTSPKSPSVIQESADSSAEPLMENTLPESSAAEHVTTQQLIQVKTLEPAIPVNIETAATSAFSLESSKQHLREELHKELARLFHYPRLAQMRGWEGTVLLDLQIETDGRISRITLAQSSGFSLLDNSAIENLHRIASARKPANWLQGASFEMQLPVIYRLINI